MDIFFIIFSAGLGTRLKTPFPKPLSPILNSKIIDFNINSIIKLTTLMKLRRFVIYINLHKDGDKIYKHVNQKYEWLVKKQKICFLFEHKPLGHIGTIDKLKYHILEYNKLVLLNSDIIIPSLEELLKKICIIDKSSLILYKTNPDKSKSKTLTHFETLPHPIEPFYKIKTYTKELENRKYINLYTGVSMIKINKKLSVLLLNENFKQINFLEFINFIITHEELLAIFCSKFYEITNTKDLLIANVNFLKKLVPVIGLPSISDIEF
ncbi:MAG: hypothetical protein RMJ51_06165 [Candidatus Calescibacterium sp.]|nr:hypothetical protein [Candidatus Calescibacterium sp.]MCX7972563.1 hypothetical protein [bacterium]MDW8195802.1 hypothetical protein [Candidatus Calescibacterium sp.]